MMRIRSIEHESHSPPKTLAAPCSFTATQATQASPATRTEFMGQAEAKVRSSLKVILETIRERAQYALKQIQESEEQRSMRWKCKECRYMKHFTRLVPLEATGRCPRCKSPSFQAVLQ